MTTVELLVLALAAFRLTTLVVTDTILDRQRSWLHRHFPVTGTYVVADWSPTGTNRPKRGDARLVNLTESKWYFEKGTFIGDVTSCYFCMGVWVSGAVGLLYHFVPGSHIPIQLAAIAGLQLLLSQWSDR